MTVETQAVSDGSRGSEPRVAIAEARAGERLLEHFERFTIQSISQAPDRVGLYAWYSRVAAGPADYEVDLQDGRDAGIKRFRTLLQRHTERHIAPPLVADARGAFSTHFGGVLEDLTVRTLQSALSGHVSDEVDEYERRRASALNDSIEQPLLRRALVETLHVSTPMLAAPLYIGISANLRSRLGTHANDFQRLSDLVRRDPNARAQLQAKPKSFAVRAVGGGFTAEHLEVWVLDLQTLLLKDEGRSASPDQLRNVAEAGEWLLNRWYRPYLGRK